jgi:hypothetical protein
MRKGCRALIQRKVVVPDDAVMAATKSSFSCMHTPAHLLPTQQPTTHLTWSFSSCQYPSPCCPTAYSICPSFSCSPLLTCLQLNRLLLIFPAHFPHFNLLLLSAVLLLIPSAPLFPAPASLFPTQQPTTRFSFTSILLAPERNTPCTSLLLAVKRIHSASQYYWCWWW